MSPRTTDGARPGAHDERADERGDDLRAVRPGASRPGSADPAARLHLAARLEDAIDRRVAAVLRRRGWTLRIEPYAGYGAPGWVRVFARTLLAAPVVHEEDLPGAGAAAQAGARTAAALRGWRSFATAQVAGAHLEVRVGERVHHVVTDRGGYLDVRLESDLEPGWHDVELRAADGAFATAPVHVIGPDVRSGIVSDIDDTVLVTRLPRIFVAAWNTLVRHENAREPVPGMAGLYARLVAGRDLPVVYLSTGAWNAAPAIGRFLRRFGFPPGPMLLTDWGPTNTGWFRSGREHKLSQLRRLTEELPQVSWVLVGDDGQHDPQIYAHAAQERPERVRAILVRQLTFAEHVLAHGLPVPASGSVRAEDRASRGGIPVLQGADGYELLRAVQRAQITLE
ncbi:App1 family protein [Cellulomonas palmilytica]|uniref:App1 family protein n=1 Tax=Cellulomonas palmilytica TaxID=2608402 RepID=UPI00295003A6|nr:phosphatase domain-containing protein [Cellulomonas palmilytica]